MQTLLTFDIRLLVDGQFEVREAIVQQIYSFRRYTFNRVFLRAINSSSSMLDTIVLTRLQWNDTLRLLLKTIYDSTSFTGAYERRKRLFQ